MKVVIAGGTGLVGKALVNELIKNDYQVVILTRKPLKTEPYEKIRFVQWLSPDSNPNDHLQGIDIFINLAGESIGSGRWTEKRKKRIMNSRIDTVKTLFDLINQLENKPKVLINASAIGIYGTSYDDTFTEGHSVAESDFLTRTVKRWENEASRFSELGIRTLLCRFGIILDKHEGALQKIVLPYKLFIGGNIGNGRQWMSWIHIEDVVKAILFIIKNEQIEGPVNFTSPNPVRMSEFGKTAASILQRPHWLPVPSFALKLLLGEMSTLVVDGQKVLPKKLIDNGYHFKYPDLNTALKNIFK